MKNVLSIIFLLPLIIIGCNSRPVKDGLGEGIKNQRNKVGNEKSVPIANINELEMEVNNGGLNQYFINSSGQNCFETLRLLKKTGKSKTAAILEKAISLINPQNIREAEFVEKLRQNKVEELYDEKISSKLNVLDQEFYKYPDGSLEQKFK